MVAWVKLGKNLGIAVGIFLIGIFLITLLSFFNILRGNSLIVSKFIVAFFSFFISSFKQGKESTKKGFLEGLKIGGILTFLLFLINYGMYQMFALKNLLYYLLLIFIAMVGGMAGISRRHEKK